MLESSAGIRAVRYCPFPSTIYIHSSELIAVYRCCSSLWLAKSRTALHPVFLSFRVPVINARAFHLRSCASIVQIWLYLCVHEAPHKHNLAANESPLRLIAYQISSARDSFLRSTLCPTLPSRLPNPRPISDPFSMLR